MSPWYEFVFTMTSMESARGLETLSSFNFVSSVWISQMWLSLLWFVGVCGTCVILGGKRSADVTMTRVALDAAVRLVRKASSRLSTCLQPICLVSICPRSRRTRTLCPWGSCIAKKQKGKNVHWITLKLNFTFIYFEIRDAEARSSEWLEWAFACYYAYLLVMFDLPSCMLESHCCCHLHFSQWSNDLALILLISHFNAVHTKMSIYVIHRTHRYNTFTLMKYSK